MPVDLGWSRTRQQFLSSSCCLPNLACILVEVGNYVYSTSEKGLWVNLYGGSVLDTRLPDGTRLKLTQETEYPWDGHVKITLDATPSEAFSLLLRIPTWAKGVTVRVNGAPESASPKPGTYHELRRAWKAGDVVELTLPMQAQLIQAHPLVEEARNQVAVQRGPLVYCVESSDLPKGVTVSEVVIPRGITWQPRFDSQLLSGVIVLEGQAEAVSEAAWGQELYRELPPATRRRIDLRLIPYHTWANRGKSEMTVWLPLGK